MKTKKTWLCCIVAIVFILVGTSVRGAPATKDTGVPSGFSILGDTTTPPAGYTYTGSSIANDKWTKKADMPTIRNGFAVAAANNKIYAIGGFNGSGQRLGTNEEYDPVTDTWTARADMPTPRYSLHVAVANNKIYAIGPSGITFSGPGGSYITTNEEYDPVTNAWSAKANMPSGRSGSALGMVNNKIYAIGGYILSWYCDPEYGCEGLDQPVNTNEEYNPTTNTWTTKADVPGTETFYMPIFVPAVNNKIYYVVGGAPSANYEYNPATNSWAIKSAPPAGVRTESWTLNNKIYSSSGWEYDPVLDSWAERRMIQALGAGAAIKDKIYIFNSSGQCFELYMKTFYIHRKN